MTTPHGHNTHPRAMGQTSRPNQNPTAYPLTLLVVFMSLGFTESGGF